MRVLIEGGVASGALSAERERAIGLDQDAGASRSLVGGGFARGEDTWEVLLKRETRCEGVEGALEVEDP